MSDEAPESTKRLVRYLTKRDIPDTVLDRTQVTTRAVRHHSGLHWIAVSTVSRVSVADQRMQRQIDHEVIEAFKRLPGYPGYHSMAGVSQTYEVEWDGVRRPI